MVVLVVEDNPVNQQVIGLLLQQLNLQVDFAANGQEAVDSIYSRDYEAVFMDIEMPLMDGIEAANWIRSQSNLKLRPFLIALTAHHEDTLDFYKDKGFDALLVKPVTLAMIQSVLHLYITGKMQGKPDKAIARNWVAAVPFEPEILDKMKECLGEGADLKLSGIIKTFIEHSPELLNAMTQAVERGDWETIRRNAHTLKSSSASLGALHLSELCASLERELCSRLDEKKDPDRVSEIQNWIETDLKTIYQSYDTVCANLMEYQKSLSENS